MTPSAFWSIVVVLFAASSAPAQTPVDSTRGPERLLGRVVNHEGKKVVGAVVCVTLGLGTGLPKPKEVQSISDENGRFEFAIRGADEAPSGLACVWAGHAGAGIGCSAIIGPDGERLGDVEVRLPPPANEPFVVRTPAGKPCPGVQVRAAQVRIPNGKFDVTGPHPLFADLPTAMAPLASGVTDQEGHATLSGVPRELLREVCVDDPAWGCQQFDVAFIEAAQGTRTLLLKRVGSISGSIANGPRELRENIWLFLQTNDESLGEAMGTALVKTDHEGRFHVPSIAVGQLEIGAVPIPHVSHRLCTTQKSEVHEDRTCEVVLPIVQGRPLKGRVVTEDGRIPVPGVTVVILSANQLYREQAVTDNMGEFQGLVVSPTGRLQVISLAGHKTHGYPRGQKHFALDPGIGVGIVPDIILPLQLQFSGRVIDADGKPIVDRLVLAGENQGVIAGPTNDQGYFDIACATETDLDQWRLWQPENLPLLPLKISSSRPLVLQLTK